MIYIRLPLSLVVFFSLFCCELLGQDTTEEPTLLPALTQSELKSRLETLKSVYPDWYERVSDGAVHRKASFAAKLLKDAQGTDPSSDGFYPMLWESMRFSRSGLGCETGFSAIDLLNSHYEVNAPKLKLVLLEAFGDSSVSAKDVQKAVAFLMPAIQQAVDRNDYEVALSLKETGDVLASKVFSKSLQKDLAQAKETLDLLQSQYEDYQASLALLERNDADENANLTHAQYLGLRLGKWEEAESYANKVGDENVRGLFVREVLEPEDAVDRLSLADDWWDYSERVSGAAKQQCVEVAIGHYESAMKGLSGFDAKKAEMRVAEKKEPLINVRLLGGTLNGGLPALAIAPFDSDQAKQYQQAWAKHLGVPVESTNSIGMKFVVIPPGEFTMGTTRSVVKTEEERARKDVAVSQPFEIGVHEVTQGQFEKVLGRKSGRLPVNPGTQPGKNSPSNHPVEQVSWEDAITFCEKLSEFPEEKRKGWVYRPPTEIEWEYSCRSGTNTDWFFGEQETDLGRLKEYAWYDGNSGKVPRKTRPVGQLKPNPWGLFDVHGNVFEWCRADSKSGNGTITRGGSCGRDSTRCFSYTRSPYSRKFHGWNTGFRVVRVRIE